MSLKDFHLALFRFSYSPQETVLIPGYKGNALRGGFGDALKSVSCTMRRTACEECMLRENCAYSQIFETPVPRDSKYFEGQDSAPHPFVLEPPLESKSEYQPGDQIRFHVLLIGAAIEFLPYFILAFHTLGQWGIGRRIDGYRGRCHLDTVESIDARGESITIFTGESQRLSDEYTVITVEDICESVGDVAADSIALEFLTPTRVKSRGRLRDRINFEILTRGLLRRILALSYFHCGQELELDYSLLAQKAGEQVRKAGDDSQWVDWSRYSRRQGERLMMGGFMGKVSFEGDLRDFMPFLLLGEYIHVGKGTAFGLGKYVICNRTNNGGE